MYWFISNKKYVFKKYQNMVRKKYRIIGIVPNNKIKEL